MTAETLRRIDVWEGASYLVAVALGAACGAALVAAGAAWGPGMVRSLQGAEPKAYWYLARALGFVAYGVLWLAMVLGLLVSGRVARTWPGGAATVDVHEFTTLLAVGLAALHALVLLGDRFVGFSVAGLLLPGASGYRPLWVALGQAALYLAVPVIASFYLKRYVGRRTWRVLHYLTFLLFALVTAHGVATGSDTGNPWILALYLAAVLSVYALTVYRLLVTARAPRQAPPSET